jgi:hypothetical protein
VLEKSDCAVVPVNRPNKGRHLLADSSEHMLEEVGQSFPRNIG